MKHTKIPFFSNRLLFLHDLDSRTTLQTPQLSIDESKQSSPKSARLSSTKAVGSSIDSTESQPTQKILAEIYNESKPATLVNRESVPESEEDIDRKFERAKSVSERSD